MSSDDNCHTPEEHSEAFTAPGESEMVWGIFMPASTGHDEPSLNQVLEFRDLRTIIGRDKSADIVLKSANISSKHCKIIREPSDDGQDAIILEDTSTNGTWLNKERLRKKRKLLHDGCEVILVPRSRTKGRKKIAYYFKMQHNRIMNASGGDTLKSNYRIIKALGAGAFSQVSLGQNYKTEKLFAVKSIDRKSWSRLQDVTKREVQLLDEVAIMKTANHKNIVKVYEYYEEKHKLHVIMDYCQGGDMLGFIQDHGAYTETKGARLFMQIVNAVDYLHSLRIAHRDLKPDNILLADAAGEVVKISDFGISRTASSSIKCTTIIGTPLYAAPEVHITRSNSYDGFMCDYWSLGIILYVMLIAAPPAVKAREILEMAKNKTLKWWDEPVSKESKQLIYDLLQVEPTKRITAPGIRKHPWILKTLGDKTKKENSDVQNGGKDKSDIDCKKDDCNNTSDTSDKACDGNDNDNGNDDDSNTNNDDKTIENNDIKNDINHNISEPMVKENLLSMSSEESKELEDDITMNNDSSGGDCNKMIIDNYKQLKYVKTLNAEDYVENDKEDDSHKNNKRSNAMEIVSISSSDELLHSVSKKRRAHFSNEFGHDSPIPAKRQKTY